MYGSYPPPGRRIQVDGPAPLAKLLTQRERRKKGSRDSKALKKQKKAPRPAAAAATVEGDSTSEDESAPTVLTGAGRGGGLGGLGARRGGGGEMEGGGEGNLLLHDSHAAYQRHDLSISHPRRFRESRLVHDLSPPTLHPVLQARQSSP